MHIQLKACPGAYFQSLSFYTSICIWERESATMVGGGIPVRDPPKSYNGRLTAFVFVSCIVAASGGLIFGYDVGITGGVQSMDPFLRKFFPDAYRKMTNAKSDCYCKFDSQLLTSFTSSLFASGLIASLFASFTTRTLGRKASILIGGMSFFTGAALNSIAVNVAMLILGRVVLGIGVGFAIQAVPVYLSEIAPAKLRGALNVVFQLFIAAGFLVANVTNYGAGKIDKWGWRLSLGLAAVPAMVLAVGSMCLPDTPNNLIERGRPHEARAVLERIRGTADVQDEFDDLVEASEASRMVKHPFRSIIQRKYRPQLVMAVLVPFFQQLTGINVITFYGPVLFRAVGFGSSASLMSAVVIGTVGVVATSIAIFTVDLFGRRPLLLEGGFQMFVSQVIISAVIGIEFGSSGQGSFSKRNSYLLVFLMCVHVSGFGWSWGPLGWLVPSEIFPLEIRSAGQSITISVNLLLTFVIGQSFLAMICHFKFGIFLFSAGWVVIMTLYVYLFLPETKNVPIEEMSRVWEEHWFWKRFVSEDEFRPTHAKRQIQL